MFLACLSFVFRLDQVVPYLFSTSGPTAHAHPDTGHLFSAWPSSSDHSTLRATDPTNSLSCTIPDDSHVCIPTALEELMAPTHTAYSHTPAVGGVQDSSQEF